MHKETTEAEKLPLHTLNIRKTPQLTVECIEYPRKTVNYRISPIFDVHNGG
jgi:hypothetical protein